jgi:hypothetical protein
MMQGIVDLIELTAVTKQCAPTQNDEGEEWFARDKPAMELNFEGVTIVKEDWKVFEEAIERFEERFVSYVAVADPSDIAGDLLSGQIVGGGVEAAAVPRAKMGLEKVDRRARQIDNPFEGLKKRLTLPQGALDLIKQNKIRLGLAAPVR